MSCNTCKDKVDIENLSSPYVIRKCPECGREIKLREPGKDGHGIKVEKGDRFVIPDGWFKFSAHPLHGTGHFTKNGLQWFAKLMFVEELPKKRDEIEKELEKNEQYWLSILEKSEIIRDLDVNNPDHFDEIFQRLSADKNTLEWWAFLFGLFNGLVQDAMKENDPKKAAWAMGCAERCRSMIVYKENFEEVVFMGHSAKRIVDVINTWDMNKENSNEEFWQQVFKENPYVLSQIFSVPVIFIQDKAYIGGMNIDKRDAKFVDYLYTTESSDDALLIEIKTPVTRLLGSRYRRGVFRPSTDLVGSTVQVLDYRRELSLHLKQITEGTSHHINAFNPRCIVVVGNAEKEITDDIKKKSFELYRTNLKDVEIVTYDELFRKAETLATLFNLVRRSKK